MNANNQKNFLEIVSLNLLKAIIFWLISITFVHAQGQSVTAAVINQGTNQLELGPHLEHHCFDIGKYQTLSEAQKLAFTPLTKDKIHFGYYDKHCWFRAKLTNTDSKDVEYYATFSYSLIDKIDAYLITNGNLESFQFGDKVPFNQRPLNTFDYTYKSTIPALGEQQLYFRAETTSTFNLPVKINSEDSFVENRYLTILFLGIFYGISAGLMAYNFFLYLSTKQVSYLIYVWHVLSVSLFFYTIDGISYSWWPNAVNWQSISINVFAYLAMCSGALFTISFLLPPKHSKTYKWLVSVAICDILLIPLLWIIPDQLNAKILPISGLLTMPALMTAGIISIRNGSQAARYFVLSWTVFLIMVSLVALNAFGVINLLILSIFGLKAAFIAQQVLLSVALGNSINELRKQRLSTEKEKISALAESKAKSEFLAKMSHEIRTPMNGVLGMAQLLKDTHLDRSQQHYVSTIHSSGKALLGVINDILDYSKIEAGKMDIEAISFSLEKLLNECASMFTVAADEKGLTLLCKLDPEAPRYIYGDPTRLRQIILNLLGNAFKFTEKGEILLSVQVKEKRLNGEYELIFKIIDSGIGISEAQRSKLFQSFHQADGSTTRKYGGTGLGLSISKQLAELMGGSIGVDSKPGAGSTFWFTIISSPAEPTEQSNEDVALKHKKVLVIDDNKTFCEVMHKELTSWGMETHIALNGIEALEMLQESVSQQRPYDMLSIDIDMPHMNGLELAEQIEKSDSFKTIPKMLLTAAKLYPNDEDLKKLGISLILEKPVSSSLLRSAFAQLLNETPQQETTSPESQLSETFKDTRVLVAEDNSVNQMVIKGLLKKFGINPKLANNGSAAFEEILASLESNEAIDIVLMDCEMPELDGFQATRKIRDYEQQHNLPRTPIIALTAHAMQEHRDKCMGAGMDDHITKPIDLQDLFLKLRQWGAK